MHRLEANFPIVSEFLNGTKFRNSALIIEHCERVLLKRIETQEPELTQLYRAKVNKEEIRNRIFEKYTNHENLYFDNNDFFHFKMARCYASLLNFYDESILDGVYEFLHSCDDSEESLETLKLLALSQPE